MEFINDIATIVLVLLGLVFMFAGSLGILRLPDFYSRTHAASKVDTLGIIVLLAGLAIHEGISLDAAKLLIAIAFVALANPVAAHALARAALLFGFKPWFSRKPDNNNDNH
jgi:multicomponent Na+:H+ antiporter subunit G